MSNIITPGEVVRFSPESSNFPPQKVAPFIPITEESLQNKLFGRTFYGLLIADLVDYGTKTAWSALGIYALNEYVDYYGLVIKSLKDGNTVNPCEDTEGLNWEPASKFGTACYETLWNSYLKYYLSWSIMAKAILGPTYPAGAKGVTVWNNDATGTASANLKIVEARKTQLINGAADYLENMKVWIIYVNGLDSDDANYCDFSDVQFLGGCDLLPAERRGRRIILRTKNYL